jgi:hypothetical protein
MEDKMSIVWDEDVAILRDPKMDVTVSLESDIYGLYGLTAMKVKTHLERERGDNLLIYGKIVSGLIVWIVFSVMVVRFLR